MLELKARVLCHATEDLRKVMRALGNILGSLEDAEVREERLTGHYGDTIIMVNVRLRDYQRALHTLSRIFEGLAGYEKRMLLSECLERKHRETLVYIRLDKQAAYEGSIRLSDRDAIRLEVRISDGEEAIRSMMGL